MFGKNKTDDIEKLNFKLEILEKRITSLMDLFDSIQSSMIAMATVQAQHKEFISFFMNHASVDADAQEDLMKMIQNMANVKEEVDKKLKKAKK